MSVITFGAIHCIKSITYHWEQGDKPVPEWLHAVIAVGVLPGSVRPVLEIGNPLLSYEFTEAEHLLKK